MNFSPGIYPVLTEEFCAGRPILEVLNQVIEGGAKVVQLRKKNSSKKDVFNLAEKFRKVTSVLQVSLE